MREKKVVGSGPRADGEDLSGQRGSTKDKDKKTDGDMPRLHVDVDAVCMDGAGAGRDQEHDTRRSGVAAKFRCVIYAEAVTEYVRRVRGLGMAANGTRQAKSSSAMNRRI